MSRPPRILVTTRHEVRKGKTIQFVGELHLRLLAEAGAIPVPVVMREGMASHLPELLANGDGLLVTEGGDLGPRLRGPVDPVELVELDPLKDELEAALMRSALQRGLPVLGICRGAELLNVVLGGDLYTDIPSELGARTAHIDQADYHAHRHMIDLVPGSPLADLYGSEELSVTSYHHQGISRLGEGLEVMAVAPDGLVEAFRQPDHPFAWGLQFHPERQQAEHPAHIEVHNRLVAEARAAAERR
jgi:putative glutamine amidotransferase